MPPLPPNVLLITTDQQRADTIGALGNAVIRTPVLDRLVREGTAFTRAYTPCPVCVPARFALVTGQPPHATGCIDNVAMPAGQLSIMEALARAGYATHGAGKMHFTPHPTRSWGFDTRDLSEEMDLTGDYHRSLVAGGCGHVLDPLGLRGEFYYLPQPSQLPAPLHHTAWTADRSIDFLRHRDRRRPFFLWSSFIKPHPPFESPTPWNRLYRSVDMPDPHHPPDSADFTCFWNRLQNRYKYIDPLAPSHLWRTIRAAYYASISLIDHHVGRILAALGPELDNTIVIFTSDHGEMLGDYGCAGKRCMLEPSVRVPLIVRYPAAFTAGLRCRAPASLIDFFPTLVALTPVAAPAPSPEGVDLVALAAGRIRGRIVTSQFSQRSLGLYLATDGELKHVRSAADEREWTFRTDDTLVDTRCTSIPVGATRLKSHIVSRIAASPHDDGAVDGDWRSYGPSDIPENPRAGVLFQEAPELYEQIDALAGYGPSRPPPTDDLIAQTLPNAMDPRTGLTALSRRRRAADLPPPRPAAPA